MINADVIYTDVWVSMGETPFRTEDKQLKKYQVNMAMIKRPKSSADLPSPAEFPDSTQKSEISVEKYGVKRWKQAMKFSEASTQKFLTKQRTECTQSKL